MLELRNISFDVPKENGKKEIVGIEMPKGYNPVITIEPYSNNQQKDVVKKIELWQKF